MKSLRAELNPRRLIKYLTVTSGALAILPLHKRGSIVGYLEKDAEVDISAASFIETYFLLNEIHYFLRNL